MYNLLSYLSNACTHAQMGLMVLLKHKRPMGSPWYKNRGQDIRSVCFVLTQVWEMKSLGEASTRWYLWQS